MSARDVLGRYGFYVAMVRIDSKTGSKVSRVGYGDVAQAVQYGLVEAVGVYMMARWGRRASERLRIGEEFDRLGVDVYDAQRGVPDKPGMIRVVMAGVDEQFLRDLSQKAVDNMPRAARDGRHAAPTPIGYKRVYPEGQEYDRHVRSVMIEDPVYGPLVREIFARCASGQSIRSIVAWLNSLRDRPNPRSEIGRWYDAGVARLLRRRVYRQYEQAEHGEVEWGKKRSGDWNRYVGEVIHAEGKHPYLIDGPTFDAVQRRLDGAARQQTLTQRSTQPALLWGVLRCAACGAEMTPHKETARGPGRGRYVCAARERRYADKGAVPCAEPGISFSAAGNAVLGELTRLQGRPGRMSACRRRT
jgi:site-specific DNA recombinase